MKDRKLPVSVVFVTHNRKALLCQAIRAVYAQTMPVTVIVMDDASTDGTGELIASTFPQVQYYRTRVTHGPAYQRNSGAAMATSDIVFFLDDDTILAHPKIIEQTLADFTDARIGAVAIPFINILQNNIVRTAAPDNQATYIYHAFVAAAFAIRLPVFKQFGGFRNVFFYMGEEGDLCIRMLAAGYYIKGGTAQPALHMQPPNRISFAADYYGRRNDILVLYLNAPRLLVPIYLLATISVGILFGIRQRRVANMLKGLGAGIRLLFKKEIRASATPVKTAVFLKYQNLKYHEPVRLKSYNEQVGGHGHLKMFSAPKNFMRYMKSPSRFA